MHPVYENPEDRAVLYGLFDVIWKGMARKLEDSARFGWPWDPVTTPFVSRADGRIVSHVGVIDLPVRLAGQDLRVAGVHAVCTQPEHRRQGHFRAAMEEALAFIDARWRTAKLHSDKPWLYEPFGFRVVPQHRFHVERSGPAGRGRRVTEADLPEVHALLASREPVSDLFSAMDPGWLFGIDEVLWSGGLGHLVLLEEPRALVACEVVEGVLRLYDVVAPRLPSLDAVLAAAPSAFQTVELWMPVDKLAPGSRPSPYPPGDLLMVRGEWPPLPPFCVGALASH